MTRQLAEEQKESTRLRILLAAKAEFASQGFAGARMETIAREAKINKAMLHYYFSNKENLYISLLRHLFDGIHSGQFMFQNSNWQLTVPQKLYAVIFALVKMHLEILDDDFHRIMAWEIASGNHNLQLLAEEFIIPRLLPLENILREGIDGGDFASGYPRLVILSIVSQVIHFRLHRATFSGTLFAEDLYGGDYIERFLDFIMEQYFKALSPAGRVLTVPEMPAGYLARLEQQLQSINQER